MVVPAFVAALALSLDELFTYLRMIVLASLAPGAFSLQVVPAEFFPVVGPAVIGLVSRHECAFGFASLNSEGKQLLPLCEVEDCLGSSDEVEVRRRSQKAWLLSGRTLEGGL